MSKFVCEKCQTYPCILDTGDGSTSPFYCPFSGKERNGWIEMIEEKEPQNPPIYYTLTCPELDAIEQNGKLEIIELIKVALEKNISITFKMSESDPLIPNIQGGIKGVSLGWPINYTSDLIAKRMKDIIERLGIFSKCTKGGEPCNQTTLNL
jgi:hypothetical protein